MLLCSKAPGCIDAPTGTAAATVRWAAACCMLVCKALLGQLVHHVRPALLPTLDTKVHP